MTAEDLMNELAVYASDIYAVDLQRYFKTGPGMYGEGDKFIGVRLPQIRTVCKSYKDLSLDEIRKLVQSPIHEHRMAGLIILHRQYPKSDDKRAIYQLFIDELKNGNINNWDLIDVNCRGIVGEYLWHNRSKLYGLARSKDMWERRVAIISTFLYIAAGDASTSLDLAEILLHDKEDLMHKAVGWTLREVGKRVDKQFLLDFLNVHAHDMPRATLRYAVEHLPPEQRAHYMQMKANRENTL